MLNYAGTIFAGGPHPYANMNMLFTVIINWLRIPVHDHLPSDSGAIHCSLNANHSTKPSPPPLNKKAQGFTPHIRMIRLSSFFNGFIRRHPPSQMNTRSTHYFDVLHRIGLHTPCLRYNPKDPGCFSHRLWDACVDFHLG